jgi:hypothetical protein
MREARHPDMFHKRIVVGGPAVRLAKAKLPELLADLPEWVEIGDQCEGALQRMNPQATRTKVGCVRRCSFCAVPITEGDFRELEDWPDLPILCDNNLLAASQAHFDKVMDRLEKHGWADFNQGVDSRLLTPYHAERFARIRPMVRLALDSMVYSERWEVAFGTLRKAKIPKASIRSYAIVGFDSDPAEAWARCEWVEKHGIKVLPMWFHRLDALEKNVVTADQEALGWDDFERRKIMQWFYQHKKAVRNEP